jgi:hypothetical protein
MSDANFSIAKIRKVGYTESEEAGREVPQPAPAEVALAGLAETPPR